MQGIYVLIPERICNPQTNPQFSGDRPTDVGGSYRYGRAGLHRMAWDRPPRRRSVSGHPARISPVISSDWAAAPLCHDSRRRGPFSIVSSEGMGTQFGMASSALLATELADEGVEGGREHKAKTGHAQHPEQDRCT